MGQEVALGPPPAMVADQAIESGRTTSSRVVFDTKVVVSALLFARGKLASLRTIWRSGRAAPLKSRPTAQELLRLLAYPKFKLSADDQEDHLGDILPFAEVVPPTDRIPRVPNCRDPRNKPFLELAVAGMADALVTGEKDLLVLQPRFPIPIMPPDVWLSPILGEDQSEYRITI